MGVDRRSGAIYCPGPCNVAAWRKRNDGYANRSPKPLRVRPDSRVVANFERRMDAGRTAAAGPGLRDPQPGGRGKHPPRDLRRDPLRRGHRLHMEGAAAELASLAHRLRVHDRVGGGWGGRADPRPAHAQVRRQMGRSPRAIATVIDSQSVRAAETVGKDSRGYDAAKKVNGRKRHPVVDTHGLLLFVMVTPADVSDRASQRSTARSWPAGRARVPAPPRSLVRWSQLSSQSLPATVMPRNDGPTAHGRISTRSQTLPVT